MSETGTGMADDANNGSVTNAKSGNPCASIDVVPSPNDSVVSPVAPVASLVSPTNATIVFCVGEQVEGNFRGRNVWKAGRIYKVNIDGTYHISYDDGDYEEYVAKVFLRKSTIPISTVSYFLFVNGAFTKGTKVKANFRGKGLWYPGSITRVNTDGTFNIYYDDGEEETFVIVANIQLVFAPVPASGGTLKEGCKVVVNPSDKKTRREASICFAHVDGTYDIEFTDGTKDYRIAETSLGVMLDATIFNWNSGKYTVVYPNGFTIENVHPTQLLCDTDKVNQSQQRFILKLLLFVVCMLIIVECVKVFYMINDV